MKYKVGILNIKLLLSARNVLAEDGSIYIYDQHKLKIKIDNFCSNRKHFNEDTLDNMKVFCTI